VAGDDLPALAVGQAGAELPVELSEVGPEPLRAGADLRRLLRLELGQPRGDRVRDRRVPQRGQPHVRVRALLGGVRHAALERHVARLEGGHGADVQRRVRRLLLDGPVDGRLEPGQVQDQVGLVEAGHLAGCQLEVVRLGPGGREVLDVRGVAGQPPGQVRQRVEGRRDVQLGASGRSGGRVLGSCGEVGGAAGQGEAEGGGQHGVSSHASTVALTTMIVKTLSHVSAARCGLTAWRPWGARIGTSPRLRTPPCGGGGCWLPRSRC
jgi:hypothetical protein